MENYSIGQTLTGLKHIPEGESTVFLLFSSAELDKKPSILGLEQSLHHMPAARDARVCKAEVRRDCLCGTVVTPRFTREGKRIAFSYLITGNRLVICDDSGAVHSLARHLMRQNGKVDGSTGRTFYEILEQLIGRDLHHLEELEDQMIQMEDLALRVVLENFNSKIMSLYKEIIGWMRYYTQLDDMVCELEENETGLFGNEEEMLFHISEKRIGRLLNESQLLREHCIQVRELFQAEWNYEDPYDCDNSFSAAVSFGRVVWNELYRDARAVLEIWIRGGDRCGNFDCLPQHVDYEEEKILVTGIAGLPLQGKMQLHNE